MPHTQHRSGPNSGPPDHVTLIYRKIGKTHVFTAHEMPGFHVGSARLPDAFNNGMIALSEHASIIYGRIVRYEAESSFDIFQEKMKQQELTAPFVVTKRTEEFATA